jgi:hypothetical protein
LGAGARGVGAPIEPVVFGTLAEGRVNGSGTPCARTGAAIAQVRRVAKKATRIAGPPFRCWDAAIAFYASSCAKSS